MGWREIICHVLESNDKEAFEYCADRKYTKKKNFSDPTGRIRAFKNYIVSFGWGGISHLAEKIGKSVSDVVLACKITEFATEYSKYDFLLFNQYGSSRGIITFRRQR